MKGDLDEKIIRFFLEENYAIVTTIDTNGSPHNSCKGIVKIDKRGKVYLLDLYLGKTKENLRKNPNISITAVDEHKFVGYSLKGIAKIVKPERVKSHIIKSWERKITKRISQRLLNNIRGKKGHPLHPEALMPKPEYLIVVDVKEIIDLTPHNIQKGEGLK